MSPVIPLSWLLARGGWENEPPLGRFNASASLKLIPLISWKVKPESGCAFPVTLTELDNSSARFRKTGNDATWTSVFGWVMSSRASARMELHWPASEAVMKSMVFRSYEGIVGGWWGGVGSKRSIWREKNKDAARQA